MQIIFFLIIILPFSLFSESPNRTTFDQVESDTGYYTLEWDNKINQAVLIKQANNKTFLNSRIIYQGKGSSLFLSGLLDGDYYFKILLGGKEPSKDIHLKVKHQDKLLASTAFVIGLLIFISVAIVIIRGKDAY